MPSATGLTMSTKWVCADTKLESHSTFMHAQGKHALNPASCSHDSKPERTDPDHADPGIDTDTYTGTGVTLTPDTH